MCSLSKTLVEQISKKVKNKRFVCEHKTKKQAFIRKRKMPFSSMIFFMLNSVKKSLQLELTEFMGSFTTHTNITKSAYSQQRMNLMHTAFIELNDDLIKGYYDEADYKKWREFRILCMDGSTLMLPSSDSIREEFGINSEMNNAPMTRILTVFDPLNEMILAGSIKPYDSSELDIAYEHFHALKKGDLLVLDRGFGARWFFFLLAKKCDYLIRIQHNFGTDVDSFWESDETSRIIEVTELPDKSKRRISSAFEPLKFRLVKVLLDNGEIEVLATSLLDEKMYPTNIFKELYSIRWNIETNYNHLKNHIEIGNFTGLSPHAVKQDFYASIMIGNMQSLIVHDANEELHNSKKDCQLEYKINRNLSLGFLKNRVLNILMKHDHKQYDRLVKLFLIEPVPIRPDRQFERNTKRHKRRFYINQKRCI